MSPLWAAVLGGSLVLNAALIWREVRRMLWRRKNKGKGMTGRFNPAAKAPAAPRPPRRPRGPRGTKAPTP